MGPSRSDPELTDAALGGEIELLGALISVAADTDGPLSDEQVDAVLFGGVELPSAG
ncbi:MAG TPA: hypothetical protein VGK60_03695 [Pedococcus sp.]